MENMPTIDADFIDFGCSNGSSMKYAKALFGAQKGVGIDIDPAKVAKARELGLEAIEADASALQLPKGSVSFCIMSHFLEHLPGLRTAQKCVASACRVSRDFVYIRHPWFDSDFELLKLGYKFYWSDWSGHTASIGAAQLDYLFRRVRATDWTIFGIKPVTDLNSPWIIPLDAPINSLETPNNRESRPLPFEAYHETGALIRTGSEEAYHAALAKLPKDHVPLI